MGRVTIKEMAEELAQDHVIESGHFELMYDKVIAISDLRINLNSKDHEGHVYQLALIKDR